MQQLNIAQPEQQQEYEKQQKLQKQLADAVANEQRRQKLVEFQNYLTNAESKVQNNAALLTQSNFFNKTLKEIEMITSTESKISKIFLYAIESTMFYTIAGTSAKMPYLLTFNSKNSLANKNKINNIVVIKNDASYKSRIRNITTETYTCLHSKTKPAYASFKNGFSVYSNIWQPVSTIYFIIIKL